MSRQTAWNIYFKRMLSHAGHTQNNAPDYFSQKGIVLDYYRIRTEVCREILEDGDSEFLEQLKKHDQYNRNGVLHICIAIVQDVWSYLSENGKSSMPDISLSSPLTLVKFKKFGTGQYSMYWNEALEEVELSKGDIDMIDELLSYGKEYSLTYIMKAREKIGENLGQTKDQLMQAEQKVRQELQKMRQEHSDLEEKKRRLNSELESVSRELEKTRKALEEARQGRGNVPEAAHTTVPEPPLPRREPAAPPVELTPENRILEEERRQMDELRRETAETVERFRESFCQSTGNFQGAFVESLEKCRAQMDELLSRSSQEMCGSIRKWQQELYQIEFISFAQMYINLCMVIRGAKRRMSGKNPSEMTAEAWSEELEKQQKNLERIQASMENALSGMGMAVIRPQPGTFFDPYFHTKEDGGTLGMGRKIKRCVLPGVLRIRADKDDEVLFQAEVEVEE